MRRASPFPRGTRATRLAGVVPLAVVASALCLCADPPNYRLEVVAYSLDYPPDSLGVARAFSSPQINEFGQVLFIASWSLNGQKVGLYLGRPGAVNPIVSRGDAAPAYGGEFLFFEQAHLNSDGAALFHSTMGYLNPPPKPLPHRHVIWKGGAGDLAAIVVQPDSHAEADPNASFPPLDIAGLPYSGTGRLQYKTNALAAPLFLADNGFGFHGGAIEALEGTILVPVANRCLIGSRGLYGLTQRLIWYDGGPAPGLGSDHVFVADPIAGEVGLPLTFARKNGAFVAQTTVRPAGSGNPADNRRVFYQYADDQLAPFYIAGDPLPGGLPTPMELFGDDNATEPYTLSYQGAQIADENGNTILEVRATSFDRTQSRLIGVWKKLPEGLVEVLRYDRDYPVGGGIVRFSGSGTYTLGTDRKYAAMGNGRLAFWMHYTGLGQTFPIPALFREREEGGFERVAMHDMVAPGTDYVLTGLDGIRHQVLLMNAHREVFFLGGVSGGGAPANSPALWMVDRLGVLRHVVHRGQVITIGSTARTIFDFVLPNIAVFPHSYAPDSARFFNDDGAVVFTATFTDNTRAIIRAVPDGYIDPPLPGRDFWFNNAKGDSNWHTTGGNPPTNWEDLDGTPRSNAPGDVDLNTATVFIPEEFSVVLDQRPAPIGTVAVDGALTLRDALTLGYDSTLANLRVEGPRGAFNINGAIVNTSGTDWLSGTLTLSGPVLRGVFRNVGEFRATAGAIEKLDANVAFENNGRFIARADGDFTVNVPFEAAGTAAPAATRTVRVERLARLQLLGGGTLGGGPGNTQDIEISGLSTLTLAGAFGVSGHAHFKPASTATDGVLRLGTADQDVDLEIRPGSRVTFGLHGDSTHLERGQIRGDDGAAANEGTFVWSGGRIDVGRPGGETDLQAFTNSGTFAIGPGQSPFRLEGFFANTPPTTGPSLVSQAATVELAGLILNFGEWEITGGAGILAPGGAGLLMNGGQLQVDLSTAGTVDINAEFDNGPFETSSGDVSGLLRVGRFGATDGTPAVVVRLRGPVRNIDGFHLDGGSWTVERNGTLVVPRDIESIGRRTYVRINGGRILKEGQLPALAPKEIEGSLWLHDTNLSTPVGLTVTREPYRNASLPPELLVSGNSTLTVNGVTRSNADIICGPGARIVVNGDMFNGENSYLEINGELEVRGILSSANEIASDGGTILATTFFIAGIYSVGESPGTMSLVADTTFAPTTQLVMEVAGTSPEDHDRIAITGNLILDGSLVVPLLGHFAPAPTDVFTVIQATSITGAFDNVASGQRISVTDGSGSFAVFYGAGSPHGAGNLVLTQWQAAAAGSPAITVQPTTRSVAAGDALTLGVTATGAGALSYQWRYRGADIAGANAATYTVPSAQAYHAGAYTVVVTNATGTVFSDIARITITGPPASAARLLNLSARALAQTGDSTLTPGFVLEGAGTKRVLIRGVGPTLGSLGVGGTLVDPTMRLMRGGTEVAANDDWGANANAAQIIATAAAVGAFPLLDGSKDAALLVDLAPGHYTVPTAGTAGGTGVAIVELYDSDTGTPPTRLVNISNRGFVGVGDHVMVPGIVVSNEGARTFLIRAVGPTLGDFGVGGVLADPVVTIYRGGVAILSNDDWSASPGAAATASTAASVGAFALPDGSKDAAFVVTLPPGGYTVQATGKADTTGVALVEVYLVP